MLLNIWPGLVYTKRPLTRVTCLFVVWGWSTEIKNCKIFKVVDTCTCSTMCFKKGNYIHTCTCTYTYTIHCTALAKLLLRSCLHYRLKNLNNQPSLLHYVLKKIIRSKCVWNLVFSCWLVPYLYGYEWMNECLNIPNAMTSILSRSQVIDTQVIYSISTLLPLGNFVTKDWRCN